MTVDAGPAKPRKFRIVYDEDGYPRELADEIAWTRAVRSGLLSADSEVTVYTQGEPPRVCRAGTIPELAPAFGTAAPPPLLPEVPTTAPTLPVPAAAAAAEDQPQDARPPDFSSAEAAPGEPALFLDEEGDQGADELAPTEPPPIGPHGKPFQPWILPSILVGILLLAVLSSGGGSPGISNSYAGAPGNETYGEVGTDVYNTASPVDEQETSGVARTYYAVRDAAVRAEPNSSSTVVATLRRGVSVFAIRVRPRGASEEWVRIESGEHAGAYIWLSNISEDSRPTLAQSLAQRWSVATEVGLYSAPDETSRRIDTLSAGLNVQVVGELPNGWWEIARQTGGVGYLPPWTFAPEDDDWHSDEAANTTSANSTAPADTPRNTVPPQDVRPPVIRSEPQPEPRSWCTLKNGEEIRTTEAECRDRGGEFR
jgi:hypothetical protein